MMPVAEYERLKSREKRAVSLDELPDEILERLSRIADEPYEVEPAHPDAAASCR
jgi:hypothetical protein